MIEKLVSELNMQGKRKITKSTRHEKIILYYNSQKSYLCYRKQEKRQITIDFIIPTNI